MGRKLWGSAPFGVGGTGSPSNSMARAEAYLYAKFHLLIHPTVWPQYTNVTDRTHNGLIAMGEPFYKRSPKNCSRYKPTDDRCTLLCCCYCSLAYWTVRIKISPSVSTTKFANQHLSVPNRSNLAFFKGVWQSKLSFGTKW